MANCRPQWPRGLRRRSAAARLLRSWVRIPPGAWIFVCCDCCVLSGRGLCDELITRPEESYRLWCVVVCDLETSRMRRPWPAWGRSETENKQFRQITHTFPYSFTRTGDAYCKELYDHARFHASATFCLKSGLYWDITQRRVVIHYWRFEKTYRSHLEVSSNPTPIGCPETSVKIALHSSGIITAIGLMIPEAV